MKRRSSGSTEDSEDSPVEVPLTNGSAAHNHDRESKADRRTSLDTRPQSARSRRQQNINWKQTDSKNGSPPEPKPPIASVSSRIQSLTQSPLVAPSSEKDANSLEIDDKMVRRSRFRSPWATSMLVFLATVVGISFLVGILQSASSRQLDPKGCRMSYMRPSYRKFDDFDTEHTRFASKYSLYLYREMGIDNDRKIRGVPILFIPGNAGSYKQVRPIASETANYFHEAARSNPELLKLGVRNLDFFTVDFNEDITAFHGQTLLDQAEYLNEAIRYILSLYLDPRIAERDPGLPDPTSVIVLGHSMGGVVARTMLIMPNYQEHSINTILTMSAPHARPPVSFDGEIVKIYQDINNYWRRAYSQQWANDNPLWHVTLVSIAGGGLDTVVPSDYASVESMIPATHGFTVFTTTIPNVWTSMDHQAILWCDQFRKVVARALYEIVDVGRGSQTKPRADRMRAFKRFFLTGMENIAEKSLSTKEAGTALSLDDTATRILPQGDRLVLRKLGGSGKSEPYLIPIPPQAPPEGKRFTLLTNSRLVDSASETMLDVLACSVYPLQQRQAGAVLSMNTDLAGSSAGSSRLACRNLNSDTITLPASTASTKYPFFRDNEATITPFSYLQYDMDELSDYQFVAILDKANRTAPGFVIAEFSDKSESLLTRHVSLRRLLVFGLSFRLPAHRPMVAEIKIPSLGSSLLAYNLKLRRHTCGKNAEIFRPLIRQYLNEPYESKYYVDAHDISISLHGIAPYVPPPMKPRNPEDGLSVQFWTDPTCETSIHIDLTIDVYGSLGKLSMRYRTVFAAFPLLIVALVLRKQFRVYDATGVFVSFSESLDMSLRQSIPLILLSLTALSLSLGHSPPNTPEASLESRNSTRPVVDFAENDLVIGTSDPFFWFMTPLVGIVCVGVCAMLNYTVLALTQILSTLYGWISVRPAWVRNEDRRKALSPAFLPPSPRRRMVTTVILLFMVSTVIPYQFAYLVACLVQLTTTIRAHRVAADTRTPSNFNFYNYAHAILILMLWVLPINLPILVVWIKNLAVHWLTPFSSHHNVLSIMPFIFLVETLISGKMIPRVTSRLKYVTSMLLFGIAVYSGIYGVSYAYVLHYLVNIVAVWLVLLHSTSDSWSLSSLWSAFDGSGEGDRKGGKNP
ncbi:uncharacterized protein MKZ38_003607 [Zalerion maritima]|uniref:GPI inositol-deacylase n=1 Tax=Zalerion maritima TaxID=339359 RepID=A0AAD5WQI6_9PEZI|nr:uncharacterized protein MKZ38_003607 [Zalerion maritima]